MTKTKLLKILSAARDYAGDIDTDDILHYAGLERRPSGLERALGAIGVFGAGLLVGAGVGLLFSPVAPEEVRRKITTGARQVKETVGKEISNLVSHETAETEVSTTADPLTSGITRDSRLRNGVTSPS